MFAAFWLLHMQGGHIPGILRDLSIRGKLVEFCATSEKKLTLRSECSLCQAIHMQPSISGALKNCWCDQYGSTGCC